MLSSRPLITIFSVSLMFLAYTQPASACEFHEGFGTQWFSFSSRSGQMRDNYLSSGQTRASAIKLSMPVMVRGKAEQAKALTVSYSYAADADNPTIQLLLDVKPGISVEDNKVELIGKSGEHTFMLQPEASGSYHLTVTARDLNNQAIISDHKTVYVKIAD